MHFISFSKMGIVPKEWSRWQVLYLKGISKKYLLSLEGRVGEWKGVKSLGLFPPKLRFGTCALKTLPTAIVQEGLGNIAREQF